MVTKAYGRGSARRAVVTYKACKSVKRVKAVKITYKSGVVSKVKVVKRKR